MQLSQIMYVGKAGLPRLAPVRIRNLLLGPAVSCPQPLSLKSSKPEAPPATSPVSPLPILPTPIQHSQNR